MATKTIALSVVGVYDKGEIGKECLKLVANENIGDMGYFMVTDTTYIDDNSMNNVSNKLRHLYWFPSGWGVRKGDSIFLMTGSGANFSRVYPNGSSMHVVHWNLDETIWNKGGDLAVVYQLTGWTSGDV